MKGSKFNKLGVIVLLSLSTSIGIKCLAQNPIIQTSYTADPAPLVYNDTVFLYAGHDEDDAFGFNMKEWLLYSSTDMVNWTDHGAVASLKDFKWVTTDNGAWAPHSFYRNGKFYLYCPMPGGFGIGVLVADSPYGPFKDAIGKPLIGGQYNSIDPAVFVDDDGQAYLYWGNPNLWYVKLNDDMISFEGEPIKDPQFAKVKGERDPFRYQEGPWLYKRNGHYYMSYASTCCPEGMGYAMGKSATGPWEHKGMIMDPDPRSSGNHPGIIDYKGNTYVFGFNYDILKKTMSKHYERRSICLGQLTFNDDGTIQKLPFWTDNKNVDQLGTLNPYNMVEAETMAFSEGVKTKKVQEWERNIPWNRGALVKERMVVTDIHHGDYIKVQGVNFSSGAESIEVCVASKYGGEIEVRLGKVNGSLLSVVDISASGEGDIYKKISARTKKVKGVHDLYFVFKGEKDLLNFDWWKFSAKK